MEAGETDKGAVPVALGSNPYSCIERDAGGVSAFGVGAAIDRRSCAVQERGAGEPGVHCEGRVGGAVCRRTTPRDRGCRTLGVS